MGKATTVKTEYMNTCKLDPTLLPLRLWNEESQAFTLKTGTGEFFTKSDYPRGRIKRC